MLHDLLPLQTDRQTDQRNIPCEYSVNAVAVVSFQNIVEPNIRLSREPPLILLTVTIILPRYIYTQVVLCLLCFLYSKWKSYRTYFEPTFHNNVYIYNSK